MRRVAIFAHFDAQDEIKPYILHLLRGMRPLCSRIVFVSTARLGADALHALDGLCERAAVRDNVGYDFHMWQHGIAGERLEQIDELVLVNSSIFGPLAPLDAAFHRMSASDCDWWGVTDSYQFHWHVQSYFLCFRTRALRSPAFAQFWASVLPYRDKDQIVLSYELGLSQWLLEAGLRGEAMVPTAALFGPGFWERRHSFTKWNPCCRYPLRQLRSGTPFVKMELLRDNPDRVRLAPVYREMVRRGYDRSLIAFDRPSKPKRRRGGAR